MCLGGAVSVCNAMLFKYEHVTSDRRDEWALLHDSGQARKAMRFKASFGGECGASMPYFLSMPSKQRRANIERFARAMVFCDRALALKFMSTIHPHTHARLRALSLTRFLIIATNFEFYFIFNKYLHIYLTRNKNTKYTSSSLLTDVVCIRVFEIEDGLYLVGWNCRGSEANFKCTNSLAHRGRMQSNTVIHSLLYSLDHAI